MARHVMKLPDVGEGVVEAELVEWKVQLGDAVSEDQHLVDIMTDKATVELTAPVSGVVVELCGAPGDRLRVGSALITFETEAVAGTAAQSTAPAPAVAAPAVGAGHARDSGPQGRRGTEIEDANQRGLPPANRGQGPLPQDAAPASAITQGSLPRQSLVGAGHARDSSLAAGAARRPLAAPTVRRRAREAQVDLAEVSGTGRGGRVSHEDLNRYMTAGHTAPAPRHVIDDAPEIPAAPIAQAPLPASSEARVPAPPAAETQQIRLVGLRRVIAENMARSKRSIPHFTYVEEIDVTELERLRQHLNTQHAGQRPKLSYLPFLMLALVRALRDYPQCNAHYDEAATTVTRYAAVHCGIATQTPGGLMVPVVRNCETRDLWDCAGAMQRVAQAARDGKAAREELGGSTITITSLGALGGIVSTPVINYPEVSIIGVNRSVERPVVVDGQIVVRRMMNLSCSFDHRVVDGHDAASFVQRIRGMLEYPPTLFV